MEGRDTADLKRAEDPLRMVQECGFQRLPHFAAELVPRVA